MTDGQRQLSMFPEDEGGAEDDMLAKIEELKQELQTVKEKSDRWYEINNELAALHGGFDHVVAPEEQVEQQDETFYRLTPTKEIIRSQLKSGDEFQVKHEIGMLPNPGTVQFLGGSLFKFSYPGNITIRVTPVGNEEIEFFKLSKSFERGASL